MSIENLENATFMYITLKCWIFLLEICNLEVELLQRWKFNVLILKLCEDHIFATELFCVVPKFRKSGVGTQLLSYTEDELAHADKKTLLPRNAI